MNKPLHGKRILVTRPAGQAGTLAALIEAQGGEAVIFPLLEIGPADDVTELQMVAGQLDAFFLVVFISPNAVDYSLPTLLAGRTWPASVQTAAIGPGTVAALTAHGIAGTQVPVERFDSEALLELPALQAERVAGQQVLVLRGNGGRELLAETLRERGAEVQCVTCYQRSAPSDATPLVSLLRNGRLDALTVSSSEGLRHLFALLDAEEQARLRDLPVFVPHARIAEAGTALGLQRLVLTPPADAGIIDGLCHFDWLNLGFAMNDSVDSQSPQFSSPSAHASVSEDVPVAATSAVAPPADGKSAWLNPWLAVAVVALGLAGWQWVETRTRLADTQQELTKRLSASDSVANESRVLSKQAQEQLAALQAKIGELEGRLSESKKQQDELTGLYQNLARTSEETALADIEQSVTLASQQLQLAGNVQGAILALQAADAHLAGSERPQFIGLRKVLTRDLDRLRAVPQVDMPGMYVRLESVIVAVDSLPLAATGRPQEEPKAAVTEAASPASLGYWQRLASDVWQEVRGLVRIQRFDREEPGLLAPGQAFFLRENLKLRLLNARLALLSRDQSTYRNELKQAQVWLERYFAGGEKAVQATQDSLKQLSATEISIELPNLTDSLSAIKNARLGKERK